MPSNTGKLNFFSSDCFNSKFTGMVLGLTGVRKECLDEKGRSFLTRFKKCIFSESEKENMRETDSNMNRDSFSKRSLFTLLILFLGLKAV